MTFSDVIRVVNIVMIIPQMRQLLVQMVGEKAKIPAEVVFLLELEQEFCYGAEFLDLCEYLKEYELYPSFFSK